MAHLSQKAREVINECGVIVGYATYIRLLGDLTRGKEIVSSGMAQEMDRASQAIEKALLGKQVCIISSGDAGIYGMAGVVLELLKKKDAARLKIEIIPGITAACACASLLGAPLAQDFSVISLSDLLVDRREIEKKLKLAVKADFVIVLYNPKSNSRIKPLERAWKILMQYRPSRTPVGIVKNAYRDQQEVKIISIKEAYLLKDINMATTIIVGNSRTFVKDGYMVTARGYDIREGEFR